MSMDFDEQYDKIYKYCYYRLKHRELAEDVTQETFLRFFESSGYKSYGKSLQYLYTVARNLCIDEYRKKTAEPLADEPVMESGDSEIIVRVALRDALASLDEDEREMLLLRYANEVPASVIGNIYGISRFSVHRKIKAAVKKLKMKLED